MSATNEEILGRSDANDLEAILAITNDDMDSVIHAVKDNADAIFTWDYEKGQRPALNKLYEKAKTSQWNGETDLPWDTDVDIEKVVAQTPVDPDNDPVLIAARMPGNPLANWGDTEFTNLKMEMQNWTLSQFMHGEQGAAVHRQDRRDRAVDRRQVLRVDAGDGRSSSRRGVRQVPRHKLTGHYPINAHLRMLLDDIINDSRWDMTYLGMQIMVEGLALAAFGFLHMLTEEPLLKQLLRYVMSDEARHVAFGVLSLKEYYGGPDRRRDARAPAVHLRGRRAHA